MMVIHDARRIEPAAATPKGRCLDCENCTGICREVLDMLVVPSLILKTKPFLT